MEDLFLAFAKIGISLSLVLILAIFTNAIFQNFFPKQSKILLKFNLCLFCLSLLLPLLPSVANESFEFEAPLKVWSSESFKKGQWNDGLKPVLAISSNSKFNVQTPNLGLAIAGMISFLFFNWLWQFRKLQKLINGSHLWKQNKQLQIFLSHQVSAPVSFRIANNNYILLPYWILEKREILHLSLRHEFCHMRRGDLWTAQFLSLMKFLFLWNPIFLIWERQIQNLQEMACDETVVGHYRINRQVYSRCLFEVANRSHSLGQTLVGTPGVLAFGSGEHLLRRIKVMIQKPKQSSKWAAFGILAAGFFSCHHRCVGCKEHCTRLAHQYGRGNKTG
jgi:beta-lactamase regulating signal transducer with metallopeptidase domain